jgi:hypothetical protein
LQLRRPSRKWSQERTFGYRDVPDFRLNNTDIPDNDTHIPNELHSEVKQFFIGYAVEWNVEATGILDD